MSDATPERTHYRICPLCEACCGLEVRTRGEQRGAASAAPTTTSSARLHLPQGRTR